MEQPSLPPPKETMIHIYIDDNPTPFKARRDVCFHRSRWIKNELRYKNEQEQWVQLEGLDDKISHALIAYFQLNSRPIRGLTWEDRKMVMEIFQLNELQEEYERDERLNQEAKAAAEEGNLAT